MDALMNIFCMNRRYGFYPLALTNLLTKVVLINLFWTIGREFDNTSSTCPTCSVPMRILLFTLGVGGLIVAGFSLYTLLNRIKLEKSCMMYPYVTVMGTELIVVTACYFNIMCESPAFELSLLLAVCVQFYFVYTFWCIFIVFRVRGKGTPIASPPSTAQDP